MSLISKLEYERNQYYKLQEKIDVLIEYLNKSIEHIDETSIVLDKSFLIDNSNIDNFFFKEKITNIKDIIKVINETIIPNITQKINSLSEEIKNLENNNMVISEK